MTDNKQIATDLRAAADYLKSNGWCQNTYGSALGERCMAGAYWQVVDGDGLGRTELALGVILRPAIGSMSPSWWNDTPGRTAEEVIELLDSVALQYDIKALAETAPTATSSSLESIHA